MYWITCSTIVPLIFLIFVFMFFFVFAVMVPNPAWLHRSSFCQGRVPMPIPQPRKARKVQNKWAIKRGLENSRGTLVMFEHQLSTRETEYHDSVRKCLGKLSHSAGNSICQLLQHFAWPVLQGIFGAISVWDIDRYKIHIEQYLDYVMWGAQVISHHISLCIAQMLLGIISAGILASIFMGQCCSISDIKARGSKKHNIHNKVAFAFASPTVGETMPSSKHVDSLMARLKLIGAPKVPCLQTVLFSMSLPVKARDDKVVRAHLTTIVRLSCNESSST